MYKIIASVKQWFSNKSTESNKITESKIPSEENDIYFKNCSGFVRLSKENLYKNSNEWTKGNLTIQGKSFIIQLNFFVEV